MTNVAEWGDDDALEQPETFYGSTDEFVREFLVVSYRREVSPKGDGPV